MKDKKNVKTKTLCVRITDQLYKELYRRSIEMSVMAEKPYSLSKIVISLLQEGIEITKTK